MSGIKELVILACEVAPVIEGHALKRGLLRAGCSTECGEMSKIHLVLKQDAGTNLIKYELKDREIDCLKPWEQAAVMTVVNFAASEGLMALAAFLGATPGGLVVLAAGAAGIVIVSLAEEPINQIAAGLKRMFRVDFDRMVPVWDINTHQVTIRPHSAQLDNDWKWENIGYGNSQCHKDIMEGLEREAAAIAAQMIDPLVLDLDGDGVETSDRRSGAYFDHDGDGFAEQTGWVGPDDGLLVMDRNGDGIINHGRELFGDQTILKDGTEARNGFEALAELDAYGDGKIDASDKAYEQLRVWVDRNGDGFSRFDELHTLKELGIESLNLASEPVSLTDEQGNAKTRVGSFQQSDGTVAEMASYTFGQDKMSTASVSVAVPDDIAALPFVGGFGTVYNLHQAMARDTSGELMSLVELFTNTLDINTRNALTKEILFKWTHTDNVITGMSDAARKLSVIEHFYGQPLPSWATDPESWPVSDVYRGLFEMTYSALMSQSHLKGLYDKLSYSWTLEEQVMKIDFSEVIPDLLTTLEADPEAGKLLLSEFARTLRSYSSCPGECYMIFRERMLEIDPELGWVFDTGGLPVYDRLGQSPDGWYYAHMFGTWGSDAVKGSATGGDGFINGLSGDDVIYGTARYETIFQGDGDALIVAGGGNDTIWAGAGADILDGGSGNDTLHGEAGDDVYIFRRGSGNDKIIDPDATEGNVDTIWLGSSLTPDEIVVRRYGNNLVVKIADTTDTMTVVNHFRNDSQLNEIEQIMFMDGTIWTEEDIASRLLAPSETDDIIYGTSQSDVLNGGAGDDELYGLGSADILKGGPGSDYMEGGAGNDTFLFNRGDGNDTITDDNLSPGDFDTLEFGADIVPTDVTVERMGYNLRLSISGGTDTVTIRNWLRWWTAGYGLEAVKFADGTVWDSTTVANMSLVATEGDDSIRGFSSNETILGLGGRDTISGGGGDDLVDAGARNRKLYGDCVLRGNPRWRWSGIRKNHRTEVVLRCGSAIPTRTSHFSLDGKEDRWLTLTNGNRHPFQGTFVHGRAKGNASGKDEGRGRKSGT